ncbi:MAG TPA: allantoate amidohydrolase [Pseudolabrys sp.]|nr:allantoate amidohydrolase [Pseudolabrys sp.]
MTVRDGTFGSRILELADALARHSESSAELTCTYLTPAHRAAAADLKAWMAAAGMETQIDAVGNVVGRIAADNPGAKTLIVGSHYDTVRNAGKYDGRLGILLALTVVEHLQQNGRKLPFHLELIAFSEEEGVRFDAAYIGSSAVAGRFEPDYLQRRDADGISMRETMQLAGLDPDAIPKLGRRRDDLLVYLEVHIEQGPALLAANHPVGVVTAIAGNVRWLLIIDGVAGHSGTVPMALRHDAAAAAAEIMLFVERHCASRPGTLGTVGQLAVPNGAINVIPGRCTLSIDLRARDNKLLERLAAETSAEIERIAKSRGVRIEVKEVMRMPAVVCAERLQTLLADAIARLGLPAHALMSGAGHDAVMFDGITDVGMLFVRCGNGGVSHSPLETVTAEDADVAARVLLEAMQNLR